MVNMREVGSAFPSDPPGMTNGSYSVPIMVGHTCKEPYTCPVCSGRGTVPSGFYSGTCSIEDPCHACGGTGIVWG